MLEPCASSIRRPLMSAIIPVAVGSGCLGLILAAAQPPAVEGPVAPLPPDAAVHERYAAARLRLAELRSGKADDLNRRMPGLLTETDLRRLRNRVELLREQLETTRRQPHGSALETQQAAARVAVRTTADDVRAAQAVRARRPEAVSENDLEQLETKAEIARLRLEILSDPSLRQSPIDVMQMQIDQLTDFVVDAVDSIEAAPGMQRR